MAPTLPESGPQQPWPRGTRSPPSQGRLSVALRVWLGKRPPRCSLVGHPDVGTQANLLDVQWLWGWGLPAAPFPQWDTPSRRQGAWQPRAASGDLGAGSEVGVMGRRQPSASTWENKVPSPHTAGIRMPAKGGVSGRGAPSARPETPPSGRVPARSLSWLRLPGRVPQARRLKESEAWAGRAPPEASFLGAWTPSPPRGLTRSSLCCVCPCLLFSWDTSHVGSGLP